MAPSGDLPRFRDEAAEDDQYGFRFDFDRIGLPGSTWGEGNMFDDRCFVPNCNMEDLIFNDAVWSTGRDDRLELLRDPRDRVLTEVFLSNAMRRLQAVEQLTLPPQYSTVPNTGAFARFEHIWGSVLFIRQMAEKHNVDPDESMRLQLRALVSDMAHTTGSHLGDWLFQGVGGAENQHDIELATYLEAAGITDILRRYGFDPEAIIFPGVADWVEASSPDLCVDRVDYGLREMNRWNVAVRWHTFSSEDFTITPEKMLAMTNQRRARVFAEGYLLLSEEHWSEPTHQFIEEMLLLRTMLFYAEGRAPSTWVFVPGGKTGLVPLHDIHPRDLMYVTDPAQLQAFARPNLTGHTIDSVMASVSQYRRQYVWPGRKERIYRYMQQFSDDKSYADVLAAEGAHQPIDSPGFDSYLDEYPSTLPAGFAVLTPEEAAATKGPQDFDFIQTPFKLRQIDPLVKTANGFERLSQLDPSFARRLSEHEQKMLKPRVARLSVPDPGTSRMLRTAVDSVEGEWQTRLRQSRRMTTDELRGLLRASSGEIHGTYPFMSFLSY